MACLSLLFLQTTPDDRGSASAADPDPPGVAASLPARKIIAHGVVFEPDATTISSEALPVLSEAAELLGRDGPVMITVGSPTDAQHSDTYRQLLRRRRAKAIRRYMVEDGIALDRIAFSDAESAIATADASHSRPMELRVP
jgi:outer membrane protein OmpA-like peptidoglycan-associated protein